MPEFHNKIIEIKNSKRIWAIGSIHGNIDGIKNIHKHIKNNFDECDTIVYLGNVIGVGDYSTDTITEVLEFRSDLMAKFNLNPQSVIFLRGAQEEMWLKLIELQTSPNPKEIIDWMFEHGVDKTLISYRLSKDEINKIANSGTLTISRWTSKLNNQIELYKGHKEYYYSLNHAAYSDTKKILFVNRGVDISRPLSAQNDCFWWGYQGLTQITNPYYTFKKIVRGYDPKKNGPIHDDIVCSLYKGSGFGGSIVAGLFSQNAEIFDLFEA